MFFYECVTLCSFLLVSLYSLHIQSKQNKLCNIQRPNRSIEVESFREILEGKPLPEYKQTEFTSVRYEFSSLNGHDETR